MVLKPPTGFAPEENHRYVILNMSISIWVTLHFFSIISCFPFKYKHQNKKVLDRLSLKALLHCEMFRATCSATMSPKHCEL